MAFPVVAFAQSPTHSIASSPRKLAVSQSDILESREIQANGQSVTIQKLKPQALLTAPKAPTAPAAPSSELMEEGKPAPQFFFVGATVYHSPKHPLEARTLLRFQDEGSSQAITCWSSVDWNWLTGIAEFEGKDGQRFAYMLSLSNSEVADWSFLQQQEKQFPAPHFQSNHAEFVVVGGTPSPKSLATLQAVHDRFNVDGKRMKEEFQAREQARLEQEAQAAARAFQPKKLVIRTWRIDAAGQTNAALSTDASK